MKDRIPIPSAISDSALFAADRTCCKCRVEGRPVQIHHIDGNPANNDVANLAVLCLECHDETQVRGGFGRKLTPNQIAIYRDDWARRVSDRRDEADRLAAQAMAPNLPKRALNFPTTAPDVPHQKGLIELVRSLPKLRRLAHEAAKPKWAGSTSDMVEGTWDVIRILEASWSSLAAYYPHGHFQYSNPREYFSSVIADRATWHHLISSTGGLGFSGTIVRVLTARAVLEDVERMIEDTVLSLVGPSGEFQGSPEFDVEKWALEWQDPHTNQQDVGGA